MNISGIRPNAGFYDYNSISATKLRSQQIAASAESGATDLNQQRQTRPQEVVLPKSAKQNFSAFDYAQEYQPGASYEMKGADSDINSLDTQKAISDLDKDQVLQQYQYFVGQREGVIAKTMEPAARSLRSGENFSL